MTNHNNTLLLPPPPRFHHSFPFPLSSFLIFSQFPFFETHSLSPTFNSHSHFLILFHFSFFQITTNKQKQQGKTPQLIFWFRTHSWFDIVSDGVGVMWNEISSFGVLLNNGKSHIIQTINNNNNNNTPQFMIDNNPHSTSKLRSITSTQDFIVSLMMDGNMFHIPTSSIINNKQSFEWNNKMNPQSIQG